MRKFIIKCFSIVSILCITLSFSVLADAQATITGAKGWRQQGSKWYYLTGQSGTRYTDCIVTIDGKKYIFDSSGWMVTGPLYDYKGTTYSINSNGEASMATGWFKQGYNWYLYYTGKKQTNKWTNANGNFPSTTYSTSNCYYVNASGIMLSNTTQNINGIPYKFDSSGKGTPNTYTISKDIVNSVARQGWSNDILYDKNGQILKNTWATSDGKSTSNVYNINIGAIYYADNNGKKMKSKNTSIGGESYNFDANGKATETTSKVSASSFTGWQKDYLSSGQQKWRYYKNNVYLKNTWINDDGVTNKNYTPAQGIYYYLDNNGYMLENETRTLSDGKTYKFDSNGVCNGDINSVSSIDTSNLNTYQKEFIKTGISNEKSLNGYYSDTIILGQYYYAYDTTLNKSLIKLQDKIKHLGNYKLTKKSDKVWPGKDYGSAHEVSYDATIDSSIELTSDKRTWCWVQEGNDWYYLGGSGEKLKNQWIQDTYYVGSDGKMLSNTWITIGNKQYKLDKDGKYTGESKSTTTETIKNNITSSITSSNNNNTTYTSDISANTPTNNTSNSSLTTTEDALNDFFNKKSDSSASSITSSNKTTSSKEDEDTNNINLEEDEDIDNTTGDGSDYTSQIIEELERQGNALDVYTFNTTTTRNLNMHDGELYSSSKISKPVWGKDKGGNYYAIISTEDEKDEDYKKYKVNELITDDFVIGKSGSTFYAYYADGEGVLSSAIPNEEGKKIEFNKDNKCIKNGPKSNINVDSIPLKIYKKGEDLYKTTTTGRISETEYLANGYWIYTANETKYTLKKANSSGKSSTVSKTSNKTLEELAEIIEEKGYNTPAEVITIEKSSSTSSTKQITVTFKPGSGKGTSFKEKVDKGSDLTLPECEFTKSGYSFNGWKNGSKIYKPGDLITITVTKTFTADWKKN